MSKMCRSLAATALMLLAGATSAGACPVCASETGRQVREGIFGAEFGANLLVTLLPFPVFLALVAAIHFGPPALWARTRRPGTPGDADA